MKQAYFETLNEALDAEGLVDGWHGDLMPPIKYGETRRWHMEDGSKYGRQCSIYRDNNGRYERPIHYQQ